MKYQLWWIPWWEKQTAGGFVSNATFRTQTDPECGNMLKLCMCHPQDMCALFVRKPVQIMLPLRITRARSIGNKLDIFNSIKCFRTTGRNYHNNNEVHVEDWWILEMFSLWIWIKSQIQNIWMQGRMEEEPKSSITHSYCCYCIVRKPGKCIRFSFWFWAAAFLSSRYVTCVWSNKRDAIQLSKWQFLATAE